MKQGWHGIKLFKSFIQYYEVYYLMLKQDLCKTDEQYEKKQIFDF